MANDSTYSIVDDLSKKEEPPAYTAVNPLLNERNNIYSTTIQPQSQSRPNDNVNITPNPYSLLNVNDPELNNIPDYTCWSIFNICCCYCILGCVACYFSRQTDKFKLKGNIQGALYASRNARKINIIATIVGTIVLLIYVIHYIYLLSTI